MPKMDGIAMMERLRADQWGKTVPIIILTNLDTSSNMISTILKDQPAYYLLKANTKLEDLVEKVKDVLGEQP
jgi:CheY-like chemotaxis protein